MTSRITKSLHQRVGRVAKRLGLDSTDRDRLTQELYLERIIVGAEEEAARRLAELVTKGSPWSTPEQLERMARSLSEEAPRLVERKARLAELEIRCRETGAMEAMLGRPE